VKTIDARSLSDLIPQVTIVNVGSHQGADEIRTAIRYRPDDLLTASRLTLPISSDMPVVLYDERGEGKHLDELVDAFARSGWSDVRVLDGGFAAWKDAALPTQDATMEQTVPPTRSGEEKALDRRL
jgi:3-mercaptopyruvate sulfurtransferase SseA